jgi:hypothetical protein
MSNSIKVVNKASFALKIHTLIENGRKEITTKKQLEKFPIGSLISYLNNQNIFKFGGFIIKFAPDYFIFITSDFTTKYRARYSHIQKMWAGLVYQTRNDFASIVRTQQTKTKFPIIINNIIIYYASDTYDAKRYTYTEKYKRIIKWCEYFEQPT